MAKDRDLRLFSLDIIQGLAYQVAGTLLGMGLVTVDPAGVGAGSLESGTCLGQRSLSGIGRFYDWRGQL